MVACICPIYWFIYCSNFKGRRLKEVILGTIAYGTLGCVLFFGIFGNYAVYLQISGQFNVVDF